VLRPVATRPTAGASSANRDGWVDAHPIWSFVGLAYAISWSCWAVSWLVGGPVGLAVFVIGGLGPAIAAAVLAHRAGISLRAWIAGLLRWRVPRRYYAYALLLPPTVYLCVNLILLILGKDIDLTGPADLAPTYLLTWLLTLTVFGGLEEPGWRGHALPRLQEDRSPLKATLLVGLAWGVWHVPLYGPAGFVVPLVLAFFYSYLYNRTGSVLLCVLLHASFTAAQDNLVFTADSLTVDAAILATYVAGAALVIALTRARLGRPSEEQPGEKDPPDCGQRAT
jgi:membrane protease YdiL (CAAX protease family)